MNRPGTLTSLAICVVVLGAAAACSRPEPATEAATSAAPATVTGSTPTTAPVAAETSSGRSTPQAHIAGCGTAHAVGTSNETIASSGVSRNFLLTVPVGYTGTDPRPLVLDFHGLGATATQEAAYGKLAEKGAARGFVTITPDSISGSGGKMWIPPPLPRNDAPFVTDLLAKTTADLCIDSSRIYVAGISNGALLAGALSCDLADQLAGAAMVAGPNAWKPCAGKPPVALISFAGTADPVIPYAGGRAFGGTQEGDELGSAISGALVDPAPTSAPPAGDGSRPARPRPGGAGDGTRARGAGSGLAVKPAEEALAGWAERNGCTAGPTTTQEAADVTLIAYTGCAADADTRLYEVEGGGHTWPGAAALPGDALGATTQSIDASTLILDFFAAHRR